MDKNDFQDKRYTEDIQKIWEPDYTGGIWNLWTHLRKQIRFAVIQGCAQTSLTRFSSFLDGVYREFFCDPAYITLVEQDLTTGQHRSKGTPYFTTAYLHNPNEIQKEITKSGLIPIALLVIEGPIWHDAAVENLKKDPHAWKAMMKFLEMVESDESIIGASCHIMSVSRK